MTYSARDIAPTLEHALGALPVVVVTGTRQVGKSTLLTHSERLAGRRYVTLDDFATLEAARSSPDALLTSAPKLTIDEAHLFPELLVAIKRQVDRNRVPGSYLLSGSANFALLRSVAESLAGRALYVVLEPMMRREIASTGRPPFLPAFARAPALPVGVDVKSVADVDVLRGGFPDVCLQQTTDAPLWFRAFEQTWIERDVRALGQVADLHAFRAFVRLAALRTAQVLNASELGRDAKLTAPTTTRYLGILEASHVIRRIPPFLGNRASRIIKSPKLYFSDSGLAAHLCGAKAIDAGEPLRGPLIETYVAQNLAALIGAHWPGADLHYWHIQGRHEVDFVIAWERRCVAIEVKAGAHWGDADVAPLRSFLDATPHCIAAVLAHLGNDSVQLGERLWALPLALVLS